MSAKVRGEAQADMPLVGAVVAPSRRSWARTIILSLPLPHPLLTPNVRMHWAERARHVKAQRNVAYYTVVRRVLGDTAFWGWLEDCKRIRLDVEVYPRPRMKRHDDDNLWSALKSYRDGIADALQMDDKRFVSGELTWSKERTGEIVFTLTEV